MLHWSTGCRVKRVDGNRVRFDLTEGQGEIDQVFIALSHSNDTTGTDFESGRPSVPDGGQPVLKGVCRADLGVIGFARVQVVIDSVHPGGFQVFRLAFIEEPQRATNLNRNFLLDGANGGGDIGNVPIDRAASADDDTISLGFCSARRAPVTIWSWVSSP